MKKLLVLLLIMISLTGCDFLSSIGIQTTTELTESTETTSMTDTNLTTIVTNTNTESSSTEETFDPVWIIDETHNDEVYEWIKSRQLENGLQNSTENGIMLSLYDNALAALVYTMYEDYDRAEAIFDVFDGKIESELQDEYGGFAQFLDLSGNIFGGGIGKRWLGDNAWLLVALNAYHYKTGTDKYSGLVSGLDAWIRSLQLPNGGLSSGYDEGGNMMEPVTEAMIDSYNAILGFDSFHTKLLNYFFINRYDDDEDVLVSWPENPDYKYAIDMSSWAFLAMNNMPESVLEFADQRFKLTEGDITGYCIDEDLDAIWPEHSLQMAVAYINAGNEYFDRANDIISNMEKLFINSTTDMNTKGLPYASNQATMYGAGSLWVGVDTDIYLSSCAWYLFAKNGFNPFEAGLYNKEPQDILDSLFYSE